MLFSNKNKITESQLAEFLYYAAKKFGIEAAQHEMKRAESPFKDAIPEIFEYERMIVIFWIIDNFFADPDRKLTASVHKEYFKELGILDDKEKVLSKVRFLMHRYKEYYDAYDNKTDNGQFILASVIAKNIFGQDRPILDFRITSQIAFDIPLLIKTLKESIFDKYKVIPNAS